MKKVLTFAWVVFFAFFLKLIFLLENYFELQKSITFKFQPYITYQAILYFVLGVYFSLIFIKNLKFTFKKDIFLFAFIPSLLVMIYSFIENPSSSLKIFLILSGSLLSYSLLGENCKKESHQA